MKKVAEQYPQFFNPDHELMLDDKDRTQLKLQTSEKITIANMADKIAANEVFNDYQVQSTIDKRRFDMYMETSLFGFDSHLSNWGQFGSDWKLIDLDGIMEINFSPKNLEQDHIVTNKYISENIYLTPEYYEHRNAAISFFIDENGKFLTWKQHIHSLFKEFDDVLNILSQTENISQDDITVYEIHLKALKKLVIIAFDILSLDTETLLNKKLAAYFLLAKTRSIPQINYLPSTTDHIFQLYPSELSSDIKLLFKSGLMGSTESEKIKDIFQKRNLTNTADTVQ